MIYLNIYNKCKEWINRNNVKTCLKQKDIKKSE
jgi:hypothetical protein